MTLKRYLECIELRDSKVLVEGERDRKLTLQLDNLVLLMKKLNVCAKECSGQLKRADKKVAELS